MSNHCRTDCGTERSKIAKNRSLDAQTFLTTAQLRRERRQARLPHLSRHRRHRILRNGGKLEVAQRMANHESGRTTGLYDQRNDEVERTSRTLFSGPRPRPVCDFRADFRHSAPVDRHAFGLRLPTQRPGGPEAISYQFSLGGVLYGRTNI
jgi:hypothetical protein